MADTEDPQRPPPSAAAIDAGRSTTAAHPLREGFLLFAAALVLCVIGYVAAIVPGAWFPTASTKTWGASELVFSRGVGGLEDGELVVTAGDAAGTALISLDTDFRSIDYRAIAWNAIDVPDQLNVRLLWRNDYAPAKLNSLPLTAASGRLLQAALAKDPNWIGRIRGLAPLIQGPIAIPLRVRGVVAKPLGAFEVAGAGYLLGALVLRLWMRALSLAGVGFGAVAIGAPLLVAGEKTGG